VKLGRLPATSYAEATWRRSILASVIGVGTLVFAEVGVVVQLKDATASPPKTRPAIVMAMTISGPSEKIE
jgi:hypothetical protein